MKPMIRPLFSLALVSLTAVACGESATVGDGVVETQSFELSTANYDEIIIRDIIDAKVIEGASATPILTLQADSNLLGHVRITERAGTLTISVDGNIEPTVPMEVTIPAAARSYEARDASNLLVNRSTTDGSIAAHDAANVRVVSPLGGDVVLSAADAADLNVLNVDGAERVRIRASDASDVQVVGTCDHVTVDAADASDVRAGDLACLSAQVTGTDAAEVRFCAAENEVRVRDAAATFDRCGS